MRKRFFASGLADLGISPEQQALVGTRVGI
jgi:hypothetical protein